MDSLERLVVHVEGAVRFGTMNDDPHLRLGLMLLDGAAELLLHRECQAQLQWAEQARHGRRMAERVMAETGIGPTWNPEPEERALSSTQRKDIDRIFGAKCDYLVDLGGLTEPLARVLKKLHKYRNKAYHRDQIRLGTLASATRIYAFLVCALMQNFPLRSVWLTSRPPAWLVRYLREDESVTDLLMAEGLHARIATRLLADAGVAPPFGLGEALSEHICDRLDAVRESAEEAARFFRRPGQDEGWDWEAALIRAQLGQPNPQRVMSSAEVRSANVRIRPARLSQWRAEGEALASQDNDLAAFAAFADLEDAFEPLEDLMTQFAADIAREVEYQHYKAQFKAAHGAS